jgi:hypothetical protein
MDIPDQQITVAVGHLPIVIQCGSREFLAMLHGRYGGFARASRAGVASPRCAAASDRDIRLEVELSEPANNAGDELQVSSEGGQWLMRRGDFFARWDPVSGRGLVRQAAYPYATDSVIRIIHSLVLAESGGFLLHSASAIRNGRAFLFAGVSGAGKTTIARLAPSDVILLTDEISYVRRLDADYHGFGTPFAGELGIPGEDIAAPLGALYFLRQGEDNRMAPVEPARAAARALRNVLFFANDTKLGERLFGTVCDFVARVPAYELTFRPEAAVWDLIV